MTELKLNPNCHNYEIYKNSGRCPLTSVCDEDCVFVWKALYDGTKETDKDVEIEDLEWKIDDLETEVQRLEDQLDMADSKIEELTCILNGEE